MNNQKNGTEEENKLLKEENEKLINIINQGMGEDRILFEEDFTRDINQFLGFIIDLLENNFPPESEEENNQSVFYKSKFRTNKRLVMNQFKQNFEPKFKKLIRDHIITRRVYGTSEETITVKLETPVSSKEWNGK